MSVIKRTGPKGVRWGVKIKVKGKQRWIGTYDTKTEAKQVEREEMLKTVQPSAKDATCDSFPAKWLALRPRARAATNEHNRLALKKFSEDFKGVRLCDVTPMEAAEWALNNKWRVQTVRAMFADAIRMGVPCNRNPFANLGHPKSRGRRDITVLTADEVQRLADCAVEAWGDGLGQELKAMILFAAYTGLRLGECSALEWSDIDWAAREVTVNKTVSNDKEIVLPKNSKPRRVVLTPIAEQALKAMPRQRHRDLVFAPPSGRFFTKSTWHYYFNPIRILFNPKFTFHELRHYCASWLANVMRLDMRATARQLGHADTRLVEMLYVHPDEQKELDEIKDALRERPTGDDVTSLDEYRKRQGESQTGEGESGAVDFK
jgi:integrase